LFDFIVRPALTAPQRMCRTVGEGRAQSVCQSCRRDPASSSSFKDWRSGRLHHRVGASFGLWWAVVVWWAVEAP